MPQLDTVGRRLNHVRVERGFTLEGLANRAGLSKSFLWEVEHDRSGISGRRLLQVANALGALGGLPPSGRARSTRIRANLNRSAPGS